jgi:hypothetical protein
VLASLYLWSGRSELLEAIALTTLGSAFLATVAVVLASLNLRRLKVETI